MATIVFWKRGVQPIDPENMAQSGKQSQVQVPTKDHVLSLHDA
jgi:hypothetical protein